MVDHNPRASSSLSRRLLAGVFCICVASLSSAARTLEDSKKHPSILRMKIDSFYVQNADIEEALRVLRRNDYTEILFGLEKVPRWWEGAEPTPITLRLNKPSLGEVLNKLCEIDQRYTYEVIDDTLIHVFWKGAKDDPSNLLNMKIRTFSVHGNYTPGGVIVKTGEFAPELRAYLQEKRRQYHAQRGIPPGSPGHNMRGNMTPEFHLDLENSTVREILNAIVLYSRERYLERPPDPTGWRQPPTSWMYEFIIKSDAPTGLGGIPRWGTLD